MKVNLYFKEILTDLIKNGKFSNVSTHPSLNKNNILTDFHFMIVRYIQNKDFKFHMFKQLLLNYFFSFKKILVNEINYLGMDQTMSSVEIVPLIFGNESSIDVADQHSIFALEGTMVSNINMEQKIEPIN